MTKIEPGMYVKCSKRVTGHGRYANVSRFRFYVVSRIGDHAFMVRDISDCRIHELAETALEPVSPIEQLMLAGE